MPDLLQIGVVFRKLQLFSKPDQIFVSIEYDIPVYVRKLVGERFGTNAVFPDEKRQGIERIKNKMRVYLLLENFYFFVVDPNEPPRVFE